jgi:hypothetical protein
MLAVLAQLALLGRGDQPSRHRRQGEGRPGGLTREVEHGDPDHIFSGGDENLEILRQSPEVAQPGKSSGRVPRGITRCDSFDRYL